MEGKNIMTPIEDRTIRVGDLYIRKYDPTKESKILIGIWDGSCTNLNLEHLKELRKVVNQLILDMTFKTTTK